QTNRWTASARVESRSIMPGAAGGPYNKPQTKNVATSAKPASAWKTCAPSAVTLSGCIPGSVHSAPSTTAATASQSHMRNRASAKAAALTTAMLTYSDQISGLADATSIGAR